MPKIPQQPQVPAPSPGPPGQQAGAVELTVAEADAGLRLDRWLATHLGDLSRARVQALIRDGHVTLGRETIGDANRRVKPGESYRVGLPPAAPGNIAGEDIALAVVYEDADVIVIDKPAGLVVHPAAGHGSGTLVNALMAHCGDSLSGIGGILRPGIVHRLDKDTTGLIVAAKTDAAHQSLSQQFKSHGADGRLHRIYVAIVWGVPARKEGVIDVPLARSASNRLKIAVAKGTAGRRAVTHYRVLETFAGKSGRPAASLVELKLETGRTHQIRVHLAHIGHPLLGDQAYGAHFKTRIGTLSEQAGEAVSGLHRQALHAASLGFAHPGSGEALGFESKIPEDLQRVIDALRQGDPSAPRADGASVSAAGRRRPGRARAKAAKLTEH